MSTAVYLAVKEIWRNRTRFLLFSMVIALITLLILFVAGLSEGLGDGNREYLQKMDAELLVYQRSANLSIASSRLERDILPNIRIAPGVHDVGPISFGSGSVVLGQGREPLKVSIIGVEPGKPGEPPVVAGESLNRRGSDEVILDRTVAMATGMHVGDEITLRSLQGRDEQEYTLTIVGLTDSRKYSLRPSVFVPYLTWGKVKPGMMPGDDLDLSSNVVAVQLSNPEDTQTAIHVLEDQVPNTHVVDLRTAYESTPGYKEQQNTLNTQQVFALLIGVLVIGGFFQIQTLQKVPQIGMLKAIGAPNSVVATAAIVQIIVVTVLGIALGSMATLLLALGFPPTIPITFTPQAILTGIGSILVIGPIGGFVAVRSSLKVEPLTALGLSS
jgi:putative ABC transport system permease protein